MDGYGLKAMKDKPIKGRQLSLEDENDHECSLKYTCHVVSARCCIFLNSDRINNSSKNEQAKSQVAHLIIFVLSETNSDKTKIVLGSWLEATT